MNKFKKIGLTALAGSLVATSVFAGTLDVSGGASLEVQQNTNQSYGKKFTMGNSVNFAGSETLDNGLTISMSFELDQGAMAAAGGPFDSHSMTIATDSLGSVVFAGHGGSSAQSAVDDTATGDFWDNGFTTAGETAVQGGIASATDDNMMTYTAPTLMDDLSIKASYVPKSANEHKSSVDFALAYTGVEGLTLGYANGEDNAAKGSEADVQTVYGSYAFSSFTVAATQSDKDSVNVGSTSDREYSAYALTYTANPDLTLKYGVSEHETPNDSTDSNEEVSGFTASYTSGGMTLSTKVIEMKNVGGVGTNDSDMWELAALPRSKLNAETLPASPQRSFFRSTPWKEGLLSLLA
jgi:outer membrane protein OmpU